MVDAYVVDGSIMYHNSGWSVDFPNDRIYVGHNIKFDMLYWLKDLSITGFKNLKLWDTMIVEYIITGQQTKYASLDKLSEKYGGTIKDSKIKDYWDRGVDTEDIPEDELLPYLKQDLLNTDRIFQHQWDRVQFLGILPLVEAQMNALKATIIMEWNGMHFDIELAYKKAEEIYKELKECKDSLITSMSASGITNPNPSSNEHISLYLFGGVQSVDCTVPMFDKEGNILHYKSGPKVGKPRTKKGKKDVVIDWIYNPTGATPSSKKYFYKVGDAELKELSSSHIVNYILKYRSLYKDLNTYYIGFAKLMWPHDDKIHGTINHCGTATGRLSSTKPNLQNLSGKDT